MQTLPILSLANRPSADDCQRVPLHGAGLPDEPDMRGRKLRRAPRPFGDGLHRDDFGVVPVSLAYEHHECHACTTSSRLARGAIRPSSKVPRAPDAPTTSCAAPTQAGRDGAKSRDGRLREYRAETGQPVTEDPNRKFAKANCFACDSREDHAKGKRGPRRADLCPSRVRCRDQPHHHLDDHHQARRHGQRGHPWPRRGSAPPR